MKYMGSKNRISKYILPIMLKERKPDQCWVEPFVGGANLLDKVAGKRIGADSNRYTIEALLAIRDSIDELPKDSTEFTEAAYKQLRENDNYRYKGYAGFAFSYAGKWLGGWRRDIEGHRDYVRESYENAVRQSPKLKSARFIHTSYEALEIPSKSLIYCDPPYAKSTGYKDKFNHADFWQWCRNKTREGHTVFISEYEAPPDFECIWEKDLVSSLTKNTGGKIGIEKLFRYKSPINRRDWTAMMYSNPMDVVASTIRAGIKAPPGKKLVVCDLGSIESRVLGWESGCHWINDTFAQGKDTYKAFGVELYSVPYEEITKEQRNFCKPPVLGCGYRLGPKGLVKYSAGMGVEMSGKEAKRAVKVFRDKCPEIADYEDGMWAWLDEKSKECVRTGQSFTGFKVTLWRDEQFLHIRLPSGRDLHYYQPTINPTVIKVVDPETGEERKWETEAVFYWGQDTYTHQWKRISTHGGKLTENIVQAIARDILAGV